MQLHSALMAAVHNVRTNRTRLSHLLPRNSPQGVISHKKMKESHSFRSRFCFKRNSRSNITYVHTVHIHIHITFYWTAQVSITSIDSLWFSLLLSFFAASSTAEIKPVLAILSCFCAFLPQQSSVNNILTRNNTVVSSCYNIRL